VTDDADGGLGVSADAPEVGSGMTKKHMGSSINDFLKDEGVFEEAQAQVIKEVVAWQLAGAMKGRKISGRPVARSEE
jgi:hypothetical protein